MKNKEEQTKTKKTKLSYFIWVLVFLFPLFAQTPSTHAAILQFDVGNLETHPAGRLGLALKNSLSNRMWSLFEFIDVKLTVDATPGGTGAGYLEGTMAHTRIHNETTYTSVAANGDLWNLRIDLDNIRMINHTEILSQPVPFDTMFQEIISGGTLVWDTATLNLSTTVASPQYTAWTTLLGKANRNGDVSDVTYRKWDGTRWGPGASIFPNYWGSSIWWKAPGGAYLGDAHFTFSNPQTLTPSTPSTAIPEPGSFVLFGLALTGFGLYRKRLQASRKHERNLL